MITKGTNGIKLSVVIAAWNSPLLLELCLASLKGEGEAADTEVIVVSNYNGGTNALIKQRFPHVRSAILPANTDVPKLRTYGIFLSRGEIIALIEDNGVVAENWCAEIKQIHKMPYSIIGGAVENAPSQRWVDWAVYFYEYGKYMLPMKAGVADSLAGNNISYKKTVLEKVQHHFRDGFFETFINQRLQQEGYSLYLLPSAIVYHTKQNEFRDILKQCYHHGRTYAGKRIAYTPMVRRIVLLLGSPLLTVLLPLRIGLRTYQKRRHIRELWFSLPYLLAFMTSWATGEFFGYLCGEGKSST